MRAGGCRSAKVCTLHYSTAQPIKKALLALLLYTYLKPHLTVVAGMGFAPMAAAHEAAMLTTTPTCYMARGWGSHPLTTA